MQATADSKIVNNKGIGKVIILFNRFIDTRAFPKSDINKWPAIKLAVSRTHKVIGRIIFLTSSIITINIIRAGGVPWGTRWDNMWFVFLNQPNNIKVIQNVKERGRVITKCDVGEKIWGYKARKFITRIEIKAKMMNDSLPFSVLLSVNFTSFLKINIDFFINFSTGEEIFQKIKGMIERDTTRIVQEVEKIDELGSKTENKFIIIL